MRVSGRTFAVALLGFGAIALIRTIVLLRLHDEQTLVVVSALGETLVVAACAAFVLWVAFSFGKGEPLRRVWTLLGLGVASFAAGDAVWAYIEVVRGQALPIPGPPDIFYLAQYVFLGTGVILAGWGYRDIGDPKTSMLVAVIASTALAGILAVGFLGPHVLSEQGDSTALRFMSAVYPILDSVLLVGPAIFVALMVSRLGWGRLAWPWWAVIVGMLLLAASDTVFAWLVATDSYDLDSLVGSGWMLAYLLVAIGASLARDIAVEN